MVYFWCLSEGLDAGRQGPTLVRWKGGVNFLGGSPSSVALAGVHRTFYSLFLCMSVTGGFGKFEER